jgi:hypothetical protein
VLVTEVTKVFAVFSIPISDRVSASASHGGKSTARFAMIEKRLKI